jgi:hypothetical protein
MPLLRTFFRHIFNAIVAIVLLFEEWGWAPLAALLARLARLPFFAWLEQRIARLPPWGAVAAFATPAILLFPVKLIALFLIGRGHAMLGVTVLIAAKLAGTALVARIFTLTQPALMQLRWFAYWYPRWKNWKDGLLAQVRASALWRAAGAQKRRAVAAWAEFRRRHGFAGRD